MGRHRYLKFSQMLVLMIFIAACSTATRYRTQDFEGSPKSMPGEMVKIYSTRNAPSPYNILGTVIVTADVGDDPTDALKDLRREAAALGGDGIVDTRMEVAYGYWSTALRLSGYAVKFK